jgi:hypothetical protein
MKFSTLALVPVLALGALSIINCGSAPTTDGQGESTDRTVGDQIRGAYCPTGGTTDNYDLPAGTTFPPAGWSGLNAAQQLAWIQTNGNPESTGVCPPGLPTGATGAARLRDEITLASNYTATTYNSAPYQQPVSGPVIAIPCTNGQGSNYLGYAVINGVNMLVGLDANGEVLINEAIVNGTIQLSASGLSPSNVSRNASHLSNGCTTT